MLPANSRHRAAVAQSTALNSWVSSLPTPGPYLQGTWWDVTSEQWSGTLPTRPVCLMGGLSPSSCGHSLLTVCALPWPSSIALRAPKMSSRSEAALKLLLLVGSSLSQVSPAPAKQWRLWFLDCCGAACLDNEIGCCSQMLTLSLLGAKEQASAAICDLQVSHWIRFSGIQFYEVGLPGSPSSQVHLRHGGHGSRRLAPC